MKRHKRPKSIPCDCRLCRYDRYVDSVIALRDVDKLVALVNELMNELANIGEDLNWHECVLNGSWPSSVEILEQSLQEAQTKKE